ncbi:MAG: hypothetical protein AAF519_04480 [Bacteroidota bacterium]
MESITKLALKGHFELLKREINGKSIDDQPLSLLMKAMIYLEKVNDKGLLDDEGKQLIHQLKGYSQENDIYQPKPMARANGRDSDSNQQSKKAI